MTNLDIPAELKAELFDLFYPTKVGENLPKKDKVDALIKRFPDYETDIIHYVIESINDIVLDSGAGEKE